MTTGNTEEQLRAEVEELRRQLAARDAKKHHGQSGAHGRPSSGTLWAMAILVALVVVGAFFAGYLPQSSRQTALAKDAKDEGAELPIVNISTVERSSGRSDLVLSGDIQPVTEAPILGRASGYIRNRYVDIGDRVKEGQTLAEIEAPEMQDQVRQAKATLEQASAALEQASANLTQGQTNAELARVTAERYKNLIEKGAVARQDADTFQSQYQAQSANVQALGKAVSAAKSNVAAAESNLSRLTQLQGYLQVRAPFDGVITLRNIDTGALVNEGNTLLFRIAQTDRLRVYVNVPQTDATSVHVGAPAELKISGMAARKFVGTVTRTANALDPTTRTLLTEVQVVNGSGLLLPGMYAEVDFTTPRAEPPMIIRGDTLVERADGPQVALVGPGDIIHYQHIQTGRDFGDRIEVVAGLRPGDRIVVNPGDSVREQGKVKPVLVAKAGK